MANQYPRRVTAFDESGDAVVIGHGVAGAVSPIAGLAPWDKT